MSNLLDHSNKQIKKYIFLLFFFFLLFFLFYNISVFAQSDQNITVISLIDEERLSFIEQQIIDLKTESVQDKLEIFSELEQLIRADLNFYLTCIIFIFSIISGLVIFSVYALFKRDIEKKIDEEKGKIEDKFNRELGNNVLKEIEKYTKKEFDSINKRIDNLEFAINLAINKLDEKNKQELLNELTLIRKNLDEENLEDEEIIDTEQ